MMPDCTQVYTFNKAIIQRVSSLRARSEALISAASKHIRVTHPSHTAILINPPRRFLLTQPPTAAPLAAHLESAEQGRRGGGAVIEADPGGVVSLVHQVQEVHGEHQTGPRAETLPPGTDRGLRG